MFRRGFTVAGSILAIALSTFGMNAQSLAKAEELYKHTEFEASLALLDKHSADAATNALIGRDYFMLGDFKKATDFLTKAAQSEPGNSEMQDWLGRAFGRRAETSVPLLAPGFANKARQAFEQSVALDPKNTEALSDLFDYYLEAPGFLGGGYDKAAGVSEKISAVDPAEGYFASAQLAQKRKEFPTAEQRLRQAVALAPRQVGRLLDLAKFLANQGRTKESDAIFQQAAAIAPDSPKVWFARAGVLVKQKRNPEEARNLLEKYMNAPITVDDPSKREASRLLKQLSAGA